MAPTPSWVMAPSLVCRLEPAGAGGGCQWPGVPVGVGVGDWLGDGDGVGVWLGDGDGDWLGDGVGVGLPVGVGVGVVGVGVGVGRHCGWTFGHAMLVTSLEVVTAFERQPWPELPFAIWLRVAHVYQGDQSVLKM